MLTVLLDVDVQTLYFPTMVQNQKVFFLSKKKIIPLQPLFSLEASTRPAKTDLKTDFIRGGKSGVEHLFSTAVSAACEDLRIYIVE